MKDSRARQPIVMLIAKAFRTDGLASSPRARQEAESLQEAGYPVHVVAWDRYAESPAMEDVNGITVRSLKSVKIASFSRIGLMLGGLIFNALLIVESIKVIRQVRQRPIVHAHDINTLVIGCLLRKLHLCSGLVYDCREFSYGVYREWFNLLVASVVRIIEESCLRYANAVITISDPVAGYLRRFNRNVEIIYNCPSMADIPRVSKQEARIALGLPPDVFLVSSVGAIRTGCRYDLLLAAASATGKDNVHYLIVGEGPTASDVRRALGELEKCQISMVNRVPRETALLYILASDLTWAVYENRVESLNPRIAIPWKFLESMACGVPVLVESGTFRANLVERFRCGVVLTSDDPSDVAKVVLSIANNLDWHLELCSNAKRATREMNWTWEAMSTKLLRVYQSLFERQLLPREEAAGKPVDGTQGTSNIRVKPELQSFRSC